VRKRIKSINYSTTNKLTMEHKNSNFYFFLFFLLFSVIAQFSSLENKHLRKRGMTVKIKRQFKAFNSTKYSSFIIQAPEKKKTATINFNLRKTNKVVSLGIINDNFALFSNNFTHFINRPSNLTIRGRKIITNELTSTGKVMFKKIAQWRLIAQDNWSKNMTANGWNFSLISSCKNALFFGGKCLLSNKEISKEYLDLPEHSMIRIEAFYHHIGKWNSNSGYLRLIHPKKSGQYLWTNLCKNKENSRYNSLCGYETCKINVPISITIPHKKKKINIAFGADLNHEHSCDASYAISDIKIYVR
jgi:hypothetical protein